MDYTPQQYVSTKIKKNIVLDLCYLVIASVLVVGILCDNRMLDILYLCFVNFYYLRVKIHRWKLNK